MTSRRRRAPLVLLTAVAVALLAAVVVWLVADEGGPRGGAGAAVSAGPGHDGPVGGDGLPPAPADATVRPLEAEGVDDDAVDAEEATDPTREDAVVAEIEIAVVSGRVADASGRPVVGATVWGVPAWPTFESMSGTSPHRDDIPIDGLPRTLTDGDGRFRLEIPHRSGAVGPGWPHVPEVVVAAAGFALQAEDCAGFDGGPHDLGVIVLREGGEVVGRVVDPDGRPLADVEVALRLRNLRLRDGEAVTAGALESFLRVRTGPAGRFSAAGVPPCDVGYGLVVEGFVPVTEYGHAMAAGERLDLGDIVLERGGRLAGWVVDAAGEPLPGALAVASARDVRHAFQGFDPGDVLHYEVREAAADERHPRGRSDAEGRFVIEGIREPVVTLYVSAEGHEPVKRARTAVGQEDLRVELRRPALLVLAVVDARDGRPVADAEVEVTRDPFVDAANRPVRRLAREDWPSDLGAPEGAFVFAGIGVASNEIVARAPGRAVMRDSVVGRPAPEVTHHTVRLRSEAVLRARLVDGEGAPVPDVESWLFPWSEEPFHREQMRDARSDDEGRLAFRGLAPGPWRLRTRATETAPGFRPHLAEPVDLAEGESFDLGDVRLELGGALRGRVVGADGEPVAGAKVRIVGTPEDQGSPVHHRGGASDSATADDEGVFRFVGLAPGRYVLSAPPGVEASADVVVGAEVSVEIVLPRPPVLVGRVTVGARPIEHARVYLREKEPETMIFGSQIARRTAHTDDRGDYRIEAVRDGPHLVSVSVPDGPRMTTAVELVWGEERLHDIAFGGGSIRGVVVDRETGEALPGARISVFARGGEHGGLRVDATADAQGRFVATGLEPAQWLIGVSAPPYRLADGFVRVDLGPGEAVEDLRVELTKGAVLRGRVVPGPGEPMPPHLGLRVRWPDGSPTGVVWPDDQTGEFVLESLPPGSLTLEVVSLPFGYEELEEAETIAALDVDVSEGEEREVEIPLP